LYITGSFLCCLSEYGTFYRIESLHPPGNPIAAAVLRKAIKVTHCINIIFATGHNFEQNYAMVNEKVPS
jgi:hypothetical protein